MPLTNKNLLDALRLLRKTFVGRADEQDLFNVINAIEKELTERKRNERTRRTGDDR